ncbi:helix-turn-helix domain-containing protein [Flavobacterium beibuense]|uniref:helix-turn-helix domain-containing protein n=1 Tax=Flavobacterium beibuense TaxID=657326 RepID=UPI003A936A39
MRLQHVLACLTMLSVTIPLGAQQHTNTELALDYSQLQEITKTKSGTGEVWQYLTLWISKAKKEKEYLQQFNAYKSCIYEAVQEQKAVYADSMLYAAERTQRNEIIGSAYLTRGIVYYSSKQHNKALENYIMANRYIATTDNQYLRYKTKYNMGLIKYYLGYYNEALSLFAQSTDYYRNNHQKAYINSLHNLALCHSQLLNVKESTRYTNLALELATKNGYHTILPHLTLLKAVNDFEYGEYERSLKTLDSVIPQLSSSGDFAALAVACYYTGLNYWDTNRRARALPWFEKVDRIALEHHYIRPDLRRGYELLITYYQQEGNQVKELHYIKRLLAIDRILESDFKYLSSVIHRQYDTYSLTASRDRIQGELTREKKMRGIAYITLSGITVVFTAVVSYQVMIKRRYKRRFKLLMENNTKEKDTPLKPVVNKSLDINPKVVESVLSQLESFENEHLFIRQDIRADDLAREFGTNYKYLTKIIHHYRQKNFTVYLNELRVDYILQQLQENPRLRRYNNRALAGEAGFSTTQHFVRAFGARTGMPPTFFIRELEKQSAKKKS